MGLTPKTFSVSKAMEKLWIYQSGSRAPYGSFGGEGLRVKAMQSLDRGGNGSGRTKRGSVSRMGRGEKGEDMEKAETTDGHRRDFPEWEEKYRDELGTLVGEIALNNCTFAHFGRERAEAPGMLVWPCFLNDSLWGVAGGISLA